MKDSNKKMQDEILGFWFGDLKNGEVPSEDVVNRWWGKDKGVDDYIRRNFGALLGDAAEGKLKDWEDTPRGTLALIILLDQFSRNIYRDGPGAFSQDRQALDIAVRGIEKGFDKRLNPVMRVFFYMPFMHSEDIGMQGMSLKLFRGLEGEFTSPPALAEMLSGNRYYAEKHHEIIERFGRYPHRNKILGRESTPEEIEFLKEPGSSF